MATRDTLVLALSTRISRFAGSRDPRFVLDDTAIGGARQLIDLVSVSRASGDAIDIEALFNVGWLHWHRYRLLGDAYRVELAAALVAFAASVVAMPGQVPDRIRRYITGADSDASAPAAAATDLASELFDDFSSSGRRGKLAEAVYLCGLLVASTPAGHPGFAGRLSNLSVMLKARFESAGQVTDLDAAIDVGWQAVKTASDSHHSHAAYLSNLGAALRTRFESTRHDEDLDAAITVGQQAVHATPVVDPRRAGRLSNLGAALRLRYEHTGQDGDLDAAISASRQAVDETAEDHPDRATMLASLSLVLLSRFERAGRDDDLGAAVCASRDAVAATPESHPYYAARLCNLGTVLHARYEHTGEDGDLDAAISASRQAVDATSPDHLGRAQMLSNLGGEILARFERTGRNSDLVDAIDIGQLAAEAIPPGHPARAAALSNLATALTRSFERTGQPEQLDAAISIGRQAVDAPPASHASRAIYLSTLGTALVMRYEQAGQATDLDAGIEASRAAADALPADHPNRAVCFSNLGAALARRFERTGETDDLDGAISAGQQAVYLTPADHPNYAPLIANLGTALHRRFGRAKQAGDLDAAISAAQRAADATAVGHPNQAIYLSNLGAALAARFDLTRHLSDLDAAIRSGDAAVMASARDHPDQARYLYNLGGFLLKRFSSSGEPGDLDAAIARFSAAARLNTAFPGLRMRAARAWGVLALEAGDATGASDGFATAVALLPMAAWHGLDRATQEEHLEGWTGLTADAAAAAVAVGQPDRAVELLEQGRLMLWTHALHLRSDLTRLRDRAPGLAARLEEIRQLLDQPPPDPHHGRLTESASEENAAEAKHAKDRETETRRRLARDWDSTLTQVRLLDGFEHFMGAVPFAELRDGADGGPFVIVNASRHGCHALIVTNDSSPGVQILPLPRLTYQGAHDQAQMLLGILIHTGEPERSLREQKADRQAVSTILDWLWQAIADPVLTLLGFTRIPAGDADMPRIWWCPTGPLTMLPLHAAGAYTRGSSDADTVPGRVVSSYALGLASLRRARGTVLASYPAARQLIVGMPATPGRPSLPAVPAELQAIETSFPLPPGARRSIKEKASRTAVLRALPRYPWAHLACHVYQDHADPSASALALWDGSLTLAELANLRIRQADLMFLSACQTATGTTRLPDEAIHFAAAAQLLGYQHVIATMWAIADAPAAAIAQDVYTQLAGPDRPSPAQAARALHHATGRLRAAYPDNPLLWAPYMHFGP